MKTRLIIGFSMVLNVALAVAILKTSLPDRRPSAATSVATAISQSPSLVEIFSLAGLRLRWSDIVSEDLKIYRNHLRVIGCPESTVREIIRAVINETFGSQRRDILMSSQDQYWDMVLRGDLIRRQGIPETEWANRLTALAEKRKQLIADVLGRDILEDDNGQQTLLAELAQRSSWLPPEKRERLMELEEKYQQHLADWSASFKSLADGAPTSGEEANLQNWQNEFDEAEKQLLTPEELEELKLRESDVADWAASLPGFNPTEDEWRNLTELRSQFEKSQNAPESSDSRADFDDAIKLALGPDRFAQYELANNDQYQALYNVTQRYGLPDSVAAQGLEIQQTAQEQAEQVRTNPNLSSEAQQASLDAIQQETEQTLAQMLGSKVLSTYKEYGGGWIMGLNR